jgi:hypothetical protein
MKKLVLVLLSLVLAMAMSCVTVRSGDSDAEGDEKIKDTVEDIRKKEAQVRKEQEERREQEEAEEEEWWRQDPGEDDRYYGRYYGSYDDEEEGRASAGWSTPSGSASPPIRMLRARPTPSVPPPGTTRMKPSSTLCRSSPPRRIISTARSET